ncbi:MAG TPA: GDP-mannose 4,6-dehydratase, partial [Candidatus Wunengus sp. YC64]|uniref:GDP-mannose 4,6-dehydratase n=1 Tax=Candidatus Wunengus sp. YC64 TaxID=3367700 RepID=UPI0040250A86
YLGNLEAKRDWGFAPEYVMCQWLMLQQDMPEDYIIGTGESHTVREFLELAFNYVGIEIEWKGKGIHQKGIIKSLDCRHQYPTFDKKEGEVLIEVDPKYFRPTEVDFLLADAGKAKGKLGWEPKIVFKELVKIMIDSDTELIGLKSKGEGISIIRKKGITWINSKIRW